MRHQFYIHTDGSLMLVADYSDAEMTVTVLEKTSLYVMSIARLFRTYGEYQVVDGEATLIRHKIEPCAEPPQSLTRLLFLGDASGMVVPQTPSQPRHASETIDVEAEREAARQHCVCYDKENPSCVNGRDCQF